MKFPSDTNNIQMRTALTLTRHLKDIQITQVYSFPNSRIKKTNKKKGSNHFS